MNEKRQAIVIGLGPAGLNAARSLSGLGLDVLLMDENRRPGGQFLRRTPETLGLSGRPEKDASRAEGLRLIDRFLPGSFEINTGTQIMEVENDGTVWGLDQDDRIREERAEYIILSTGAREKFIPFPGWTLPGVVSCGAAQILLKSCGMLPGHAPLVGGCGPLPLVLAGEMLAAQGRIRGFWDQSPWSSTLHSLTHFRHHYKKIAQGLGYMARLGLSGTAIMPRTRIVEASGDGVLQRVVLARMDNRGRTVIGTEKVYDTDCLAVGAGFTPNIELAMLAGCELEFSEDKGGWIVEVDDYLRTSRPNFFAAGEITGIAGAAKSFTEGRMAGLAVARKLGKVNEVKFRSEMKILARERRREMTFGEYVNAICRPPAGMLDEIPDQTIVCRCEDVTMGQVREQIKNGFTTLDALKKSTNSGMGNCQGRTCGPILRDILEAHASMQPANIAPLTVRSPIKPLPLSALAAWEDRRNEKLTKN